LGNSARNLIVPVSLDDLIVDEVELALIELPAVLIVDERRQRPLRHALLNARETQDGKHRKKRQWPLG
jgi:hypothetical protein